MAKTIELDVKGFKGEILKVCKDCDVYVSEQRVLIEVFRFNSTIERVAEINSLINKCFAKEYPRIRDYVIGQDYIKLVLIKE